MPVSSAMKWKYVLVTVLCIVSLVMVLNAVSNRGADNADNKAFSATWGAPPTPSKPYNILDYTKPPAKP